MSAPSSCPASLLYRDALHSVFSFLCMRDLNFSAQTHSAWMTAACNAPSQGKTIRLSAPLKALLPSRLLTHVSHISTDWSNKWVQLDSKLLEQVCVRMPQLRTLGCTVNVPQKQPFRFPPSLHSLHLRLASGNFVPINAAIQLLTSMPRLSSLSLHLAFDPQIRFAALASLSLHHFGLHWTGFEQGFSDDQIDDIRLMTQLRSLSLSSQFDDTGFLRLCAPPCSLPHLQSIEVPVDLELSAASMASLALLPSISHLKLKVFGDVESLSGFAALVSLELSVDVNSSSSLLRSLASCASLTRLNLLCPAIASGPVDSHLQYALTEGLPSLTHLVLVRVHILHLSCLVTPRTIHSLRHLEISRCRTFPVDPVTEETTELLELLALVALESIYWRANSPTSKEHQALFALPSMSLPKLTKSFVR